MRQRFRVLSLFALTVVHLDAQAAVGRTPGSFDVTATGEATYTIPIAVPPGIHGLTPQLALTYASRSRQSIAGWGWNISGAMAITRCNSTVAQDGVARGVVDSLQDRYCLNGNKLRLVSGTYGVAGSEYRTEIETFSRITAFGSSGTGPSYFIVEGKDGLRYEFGHTSDSLILIKGKTTARSWALNKVSDRDSNEINYQYIEDIYGAYRLDLVTYGGNSAQLKPALYSVDLIYEARPPAEVLITNFAGNNIREYNRLDRIDVRYTGTGTPLYRRYDLTYEASLSAAIHSRLASVIECAGSAPACLPATTFAYENSPPLDPEGNTGAVVPVTTPLPLDINGDGRDDLVYPNGGFWMVMFANSTGTGYGSPVNTAQPSTGSAGAIPFDYDADGRDDLLVPYSGGTWWVLYGSASGLSAPQNTGAAATATGTGDNARALDIDGDGQDDLVWADLNPVQYGGGDVIRWKRKIPGGGFVPTATDLITPLLANQMIPTGVFAGWAQTRAGRVPDFNGDGRDDLAFRKYIRQDISSVVGEGISRNEGTATTAVTWKYIYRLVVVCPGVTDCLTSAGGVASEPYFGDFNGDRMTDLLYFDDDGNWKYRFSNGTGFDNAQNAGSLSSYLTVMIMDLDNDGYDDVLLNHTATSTWHVMRSTGEVLSAPVPTGMSSAGTSAQIVTDMNGDGQREIAYRGSGNTWRYKARPVTLDNQDQMITATDGFGVAVTFNYAPITLPSVYSKGTGATYPKSDTQEALWVVNSLNATDGTGTGSNFTLTFTYESARLDLPGRGFLGFGKRTIVDSRMGYNLKTIETYLQDFPYIGALDSVEQRQSSGTRISYLKNTWAELPPWGVAGSTDRHFPYVRVRALDEHEVGGTMNGTKFRTVTTTVASGGVDPNSGLITNSSTATTDLIGGTSATEQVEHTALLNDLTSNWCIGRPTATQVTKSHSLPTGGAITRTFDATWDAIKCRPTQRQIEPANAAWRVTLNIGYDNFGNVNSESVIGGGSPTPMAARTTTTNWGADGLFPIAVTNALSQTTNRAWNYTFGLPASETDPNGIVTSWLYDDFGRRTRENRPDLTYTVYDYLANFGCDPRLKLAVHVTPYSSTNAMITDHYVFLDRFERPIVEHDLSFSTSSWNTVVRTYDALGRVSTVGAPYSSAGCTSYTPLFVTSVQYDAVSRPTQISRPTSDSNATLQTTTSYYEGLTTRVVDPLGKQTTQIVDVAGSLARDIDHDGYYQNFDYDSFGNLVQVTDSSGNTLQSNVFNIRGLRTDQTDMDAGHWTFTPNALGEVTAQADANGRNTTFGYDPLGRMTSRAELEGNSTFTFGTSAAAKNIGRLASMAGPGYSEALTYDSIGRLQQRSITSDSATAYDFNLTYNNQGSIDTLTYPTSTSSYRLKLQYEYQSGQLLKVKDFNAPTTVFWQGNAADAWGNPIDETLGNGVKTVRGFDMAVGMLDYIQSGPSGGTALQNLTFTWDAVGNLTQRQNVGLSLTEGFGYDNLHRLTSTTGTDPKTLTYNAMGNILTKTGVGTYSYHATKKHQVTAAGTNTYAYDANGNMTSRNGLSTSWYSYNLPNTINGPSSNSSQFFYAPDRSRWKQVASYAGTSEQTIYIGGLLEKVTLGGATHWKHYIAGGTGVVAEYIRHSTGTNETVYLLKDHLGSTEMVTNSSGVQMSRLSYDAWGRRRNGGSWNGNPAAAAWTTITNTTRHGFTSHEMLDNLGLVHMNGRVYDPVIGRFMSADPFVPPMLGTQGFNRYAYVGNRPLVYVDPSGFSPDDGDDWDWPVPDPCYFFGCYGDNPGYPGDRGLNGRPGMPGWGIVDGDVRNNPRNGGFDRWPLYIASVVATNIDVTTQRPDASTVSGVPGQNLSDALYYPGYFPVARLDLGFASPLVNGGLNLINGLANGANDFAGWALQPFDTYAGELITFETAFPGGGIAAGPTMLLGRMSASLRTANAAGRATTVYRSVNAAGEVQYAGITNNLARRAAEHLRGSGIQIEKLMGGLSRSDARAVEQALIEIHGLGRNGGTLLNRINSIAPSNPAYADQVRRGYELLQTIGY